MPQLTEHICSFLSITHEDCQVLLCKGGNVETASNNFPWAPCRPSLGQSLAWQGFTSHLEPKPQVLLLLLSPHKLDVGPT